MLSFVLHAALTVQSQRIIEVSISRCTALDGIPHKLDHLQILSFSFFTTSHFPLHILNRNPSCMIPSPSLPQNACFPFS